jgi:hypothetical protein
MCVCALVQWHKKLGLVPPMQLEEAVFADYALWADAPRGATVVALNERSPLMTTAWTPKHPVMVVIKDQVRGVSWLAELRWLAALSWLAELS